MRLRLLPFDAFPTLAAFMSPAFSKERSHAHNYIETVYRTRRRKQERGKRGGDKSPARAPPRDASHTLAKVLAMSELLGVHVERACTTLAWGAGVLRCWNAVLQTICVEAGCVARGVDADDSAEVQRSRLCSRYVQSRVQCSVDCLFTMIPWLEIHNTLSPEECAAELVVGESAPQAADGDSCPNVFLMLLGDEVLDEPEVASGAESAPEGGEMRVVAESAEMMHAAALIQKLQVHIEKFQFAVAELVDHQEAYFQSAEE